jgi:hypothetical protein
MSWFVNWLRRVCRPHGFSNFHVAGSGLFSLVADIEIRGGIPAHQRSSHDGADLTDVEEAWIAAKCRCPDCLDGALLAGPQGGSATNFACDACGSEFNASLLVDGAGYVSLFAAERISEPGPRKLQDRSGLYGSQLSWRTI